jgi:hypothetical protein
MDAAFRQLIWQRAKSRCEYCQLHQEDYEYQTFHIEHIIPKQHGGTDDLGNCCLACSECNWSKGPNLSGIVEGKIVPLFNPRQQKWKRHFVWEHTILVGKTKVGIATVNVLSINHESRVMLRENLLFEGRFPPAD